MLSTAHRFWVKPLTRLERLHSNNHSTSTLFYFHLSDSLTRTSPYSTSVAVSTGFEHLETLCLSENECLFEKLRFLSFWYYNFVYFEIEACFNLQFTLFYSERIACWSLIIVIIFCHGGKIESIALMFC